MLGWITAHWVGLSIGGTVLVAALWWLLKPPSWRDGEGDNSTLAYLDRFKQGH